MEILEEQTSRAGHIMQTVISYVENRVEYSRLLVAEKVTYLTTAALSGLILAFFSGLILFFLSVGLALYIGEKMGQMATGFFVVSLGYLVFLIFMMLFIKPGMERKISSSIINALDNEEEPK